jgi:hypothetical protein
VTLPGAGPTGRLAFLQLDADDQGSHFDASFGVDVFNQDDESDLKLGFADLGSIGLDVKVEAEAIVDLGLELQLNSELVPGADKVFPKVVGEFYFEWALEDDGGGPVSIGEIGNAIQED